MTKVSAQTFARGHKKRAQLGKTFMDFLILLIEFILHSLTLKTMILTALANSVSGMDIFTIQAQPPEVLLKFKLKFHKVHRKTPMPLSLFK